MSLDSAVISAASGLAGVVIAFLLRGTVRPEPLSRRVIRVLLGTAIALTLLLLAQVLSDSYAWLATVAVPIAFGLAYFLTRRRSASGRSGVASPER